MGPFYLINSCIYNEKKVGKMIEILTLATLMALINYKGNDKSNNNTVLLPIKKEGNQNG